MDWIVIGAIVILGWVMLSVLSGERMRQAQHVAIALANAAVEQTRPAKAGDIPIATASVAPPPLGANRKR